MSDDPYAEAAQSAEPQTDALTGNNEGYDPLFGGEKLVSLFNKTHGIGTSRSGRISKAPEDRQSRFFKEDGVGALKFWGKNAAGKAVPVANDTDASGNKLKPCLDTVFVLDTEYRLTPAELAERGMDEDNGKRGFFASGDSFVAIRKAIQEARLSSRSQLVGMKLTVTRTGKKQVGDFKAWTHTAKLEK